MNTETTEKSLKPVRNNERKVERVPLWTLPDGGKKEALIYSEGGKIYWIEFQDPDATIGVNSLKFMSLIEYLNGRKFKGAGILKASRRWR